MDSLHKEKLHKPRMDLLFEYFPNALLEVARACEMGATKYGAHTWQQLPIEDLKAALGRHILYAELQGEDPESGLPHEAHIAWNALAQLELWLTTGGLNAQLPSSGE